MTNIPDTSCIGDIAIVPCIGREPFAALTYYAEHSVKLIKTKGRPQRSPLSYSTEMM